MHSKIITLSSDSAKKGATLLSESDAVERGFVPWIADYVDSYFNEETTADIISSWTKSLVERYGNIVDFDKESVLFKDGFRSAYTCKYVRDVYEYLTVNMPKSLKEYGDPFMLTYGFESVINDKHGLYICLDGSLITESDFFRWLEHDKKYYFGNVLDYHY